MKRPSLQVGPGVVARQYAPEEVAEITRRWLEAYGQDSHGVNTRDYLWHIFSGARYPSISGNSARTEYRLRTAHEYIVLSNDRELAFTTAVRPETCSLSDYYVFPPNLAWTVAFTHEDGWLGPYFGVLPRFHGHPSQGSY